MNSEMFHPVISFKPCYKWNTFNTEFRKVAEMAGKRVLNLVINGIPSILIEMTLVFTLI